MIASSVTKGSGPRRICTHHCVIAIAVIVAMISFAARSRTIFSNIVNNLT